MPETISQTAELLTPETLTETSAAPAPEPVADLRDYVPISANNAQMSTKIYFWHNRTTDHILQGGPPEHSWAMPPGYQIIECNHAHEAELWSKRLRDQDKRIAEMTDYEREIRHEGPMRANLRMELKARMQEALKSGGDERRKRLNYLMLQKAMELLDKQERNAKHVVESYLHVEAFEHGR